MIILSSERLCEAFWRQHFCAKIRIIGRKFLSSGLQMPVFKKSDDLIFPKNSVIFLSSDRSGSQKCPENSLVPLTFTVNIAETCISHRKTAGIKNHII